MASADFSLPAGSCRQPPPPDRPEGQEDLPG